MKKYFTPMLFAFVFVGLLVVATINGCSLFDAGSSDTVTIAGSPGSECNYDSQCQSNDCRYPGLCQ